MDKEHKEKIERLVKEIRDQAILNAKEIAKEAERNVTEEDIDLAMKIAVKAVILAL